jgi:hypothetical protein
VGRYAKPASAVKQQDTDGTLGFKKKVDRAATQVMMKTGTQLILLKEERP